MTMRQFDVEWAKRVLKCGALVESDSHDPQEGRAFVPLMTEDRAFYFVPCYADCVLVTRWWRDHEPPVYQARPDPDRPRWAVEVLKCFPGGHWEPDDYDLVEIARADSLVAAITAARHWMLDMELEAESLALYAEIEAARALDYD